MPLRFRRTKTPSIYVAHELGCPAFATDGPRCRCHPSYRGRRRHPGTGQPLWGTTTKNRAEVLTWLADGELAAESVAKQPQAGATLETLGDEWLDGMEAGTIGRRRGKGKPYSQTTIDGYGRTWRHFVRPEFGPRVAEEISEIEWQMWVDELSREGLSRSRIANHVAVVSSIDAWALSPQPTLRNPQPAADGRIAAQRREAAPARHAGGRGGALCWPPCP